jgi:hypothetical protein
MDLFGRAIPVLIAGLVAWFIWQASRPPRVFDVRIAGGEPQPVAGTVTPAFLQRLRELVAEHRITTGRVQSVRGGGGRIRLHFSNELPPAARQQLRNWWAVSGWAAGK